MYNVIPTSCAFHNVRKDIELVVTVLNATYAVAKEDRDSDLNDISTLTAALFIFSQPRSWLLGGPKAT